VAVTEGAATFLSCGEFANALADEWGTASKYKTAQNFERLTVGSSVTICHLEAFSPLVV
jgi:hypothetical protein